MPPPARTVSPAAPTPRTPSPPSPSQYSPFLSDCSGPPAPPLLPSLPSPHPLGAVCSREGPFLRSGESRPFPTPSSTAPPNLQSCLQVPGGLQGGVAWVLSLRKTFEAPRPTPPPPPPPPHPSPSSSLTPLPPPPGLDTATLLPYLPKGPHPLRHPGCALDPVRPHKSVDPRWHLESAFRSAGSQERGSEAAEVGRLARLRSQFVSPFQSPRASSYPSHLKSKLALGLASSPARSPPREAPDALRRLRARRLRRLSAPHLLVRVLDSYFHLCVCVSVCNMG